MEMDQEQLSREQEQELTDWLTESGYQGVNEWAADSDYTLMPDGVWYDEEGNPHFDIAIAAWLALEAESVPTDCCDEPRPESLTVLQLDYNGDPDVRVCRRGFGCNRREQ